MSQSFQKCTISFNQRFFSHFILQFSMTCCCYSHVYECVYNLNVQLFYSLLKNEVVDVQNEVAMDICLDLTCAW